MIKRCLEITAQCIARSKILWKLFTPLIYLSNHIQANKQKNEIKEEAPEPLLIRHLGSPVVKNGPFKGMVYPSYDSVGSTIFPKIIGSYEAELHPTIESFLQNNYDVIIDIGCAEGYYAIGFALRNKNAKVFAYDISEKARALCQKMSLLNNVQDRMTIESTFTPDSLKKTDPDKKTLIICDCEGYEADLFTKETIVFIKNATLLIETHDFIDPSISVSLQQLLSNSHDIRVVQSTDDLLKAKYYDYKELDGLTIQQRREALKEMRPVIMEWIIAQPKK